MSSNHARAYSLQKLRLVQQPVQRKTGKIAVCRRLDHLVPKKNRIAGDDHARRARNDSFGVSLLDRHHQRKSSLMLLISIGKGLAAAGNDDFHFWSVRRCLLRLHHANGAWVIKIQRQALAEERIHYRMRAE